MALIKLQLILQHHQVNVIFQLQKVANYKSRIWVLKIWKEHGSASMKSGSIEDSSKVKSQDPIREIQTIHGIHPIHMNTRKIHITRIIILDLIHKNISHHMANLFIWNLIYSYLQFNNQTFFTNFPCKLILPNYYIYDLL